MALTKNQPQSYELGDRNAFLVADGTVIFEGAAVGIDTTTGLARPLEAGDVFVGFAEARTDNWSAAAGSLRVRTHAIGRIVLPVAGVTTTMIGEPVYASDDSTFTLTATDNTLIGHVYRVDVAGSAVVAFNTQI